MKESIAVDHPEDGKPTLYEGIKEALAKQALPIRGCLFLFGRHAL